jgi:hypothetical protein
MKKRNPPKYSGGLIRPYMGFENISSILTAFRSTKRYGLISALGFPPAVEILENNNYLPEGSKCSLHDKMNRSFPGIELIGCTTVGELSSSYGFSDDSISLMVLYSNDIAIKASVGQHLSEDPRAAVKAALRQVRAKLTQPVPTRF